MLQRRNRLMDRVFLYNDGGLPAAVDTASSSASSSIAESSQRGADMHHLFGGVYRRLFLHSADV